MYLSKDTILNVISPKDSKSTDVFCLYSMKDKIIDKYCIRSYNYDRNETTYHTIKDIVKTGGTYSSVSITMRRFGIWTTNISDNCFVYIPNNGFMNVKYINSNDQLFTQDMGICDITSIYRTNGNDFYYLMLEKNVPIFADGILIKQGQ